MKKRIMSFLLAVIMISQIFTQGIVYAAGNNSIFSSEAGSEVKSSSILEDNRPKEAPQNNSQKRELKSKNKKESLFEEMESHENDEIVIEGEKITPENNEKDKKVDLVNPEDKTVNNAIIDQEEKDNTRNVLDQELEKDITESTEKNIKEENNKIISEEEKVLDEFIESENFEENIEAVSTEMGVYDLDLKDVHYVEDKDGNWTYETGLVTYFTVPKDVTSGFEFSLELPEEINVGGIKNSDVTLGAIKNRVDSLINVYLQNGRIVYKVTNYGAEVISQTPFGISGNFTIGIKEDDDNVALVDDYNYTGGAELYKGVSINKSGFDRLKNLLPEDNSIVEDNNAPLDKREVELNYTSTFAEREIVLKDSVKAYESENFNNKTKYIYNYETNFIKDFDDYYKEQSFEINRFNLLKTYDKENSTINIKSSNDVKSSDDIVIKNEVGEILYPGEWNDFVKETREGYEINLPTEKGIYPKFSITYKTQIDNIEEESKTEVILADKLYTEDTAINNFKTEIISSKIDDNREVENNKANYNREYFTENTPVKDDVTLDREVSLISNKSSESQDEILDMINRVKRVPAKANKTREQVWLENEIKALGQPVRKLTQEQLDTLKQKFLQEPEFLANLTATEENFDKLIKRINLEDAQAWVTEKLTALKNNGQLNDQTIAQVKSDLQKEFPNVDLNDINWQEGTPSTTETTYPYQLAYTDKSSLRYEDGSTIDAFGQIDSTKKLQVWWDIEVDVSEVNKNSDLDYDSLNLAFHAPRGQGLNKFIFAASNDKDQLDNDYNYARSETVGGDLDVGYINIPKSQITGDKIYLRVKADITEYHPKYSLGVRINPDSNYINNIVDKFIKEFESIPTIFKWMKGVEEARQYADIPFNLLDARLTAGGIENELKAEEFYSDSSRYVFASQSGSSISWHITDLLRLGETPDENIKNAKFYPATANVEDPKIFIPLIDGGYRQVNSIEEATGPKGQIYPGTILSYGTGRQDIDLGKRDEIEINFKEKFKDANSNYLSEEAQQTAEKEGGVNTSYVVMKTQTELDAEYRMYYETPFSTDIFRINKNFEMAFCLNLGIQEPSVSYDGQRFQRDPALERTEDPSGLDILNNINDKRGQKNRLQYLLNDPKGEFYNPNIADYNAKVEDLFKRVFYYADQMKIEYEKANGKRLNRVLESQMIQRMVHYITDIKGLYYVYYTEGYEPDREKLRSRQILLGVMDIDKTREVPQYIPDGEYIADDPNILVYGDKSESASSYYIRNKQATLARKLYDKVIASYGQNSDWNDKKRDSVDLTLYTHGKADQFQQLISGYVNRPIEVKKVDREEKTLAGVEFKITNLVSGETFTWTSNENEKSEVFLKPGKYRLEETKTPEDYEPMKPVDFEVVKKEENPRDLFFPKINKDIHVNDYVHNVARLRQGTEIPMSADGTILLYKSQDNKDMGFVVKNVLDDLGKLEFTKTDGVNPLAGVEFTLLKVDDQGNVINGEDGKPVFEKVSSGKNGKYLFEGIGVGNYILRETKTPEGFEKLEDIKVIATKETDPQTGKTKVVAKFVDTNLEASKTLVNTPEKIGIDFQKYSKNQNRPLKGGKFVLYQKSGTSYSYYKEVSASEVKVIRDNKDNIIGYTGGRFIFDELSIGEYILEERLAPEGYDKVKYTDEEGNEHLMKWLVKVELNKEELEQNPNSKNKLKYSVYEYKNGKLGNKIETTEILDGDKKDNVYRIYNEPFQTNMSFKKMTRDIVNGKVTSEKKLTQNDLLKGANGKPVEFALYNSDYYGAKLNKDGSIPKPKETPEPIQTVKADKDGNFNFTNLTTGQYYKLEEVNPPLGYDKLQNGLLIHVVSYGGPNLRVVLRDPSNNAVVDEHNVLQFVVNTKGKLGELKVKKTGNALLPYHGEIGLRRAYFRLYYADENFNKRKDPETGIEYIQKITEGLTQQDPDTGAGRDPSTLPENQGMAVFDNLRPGKYILEEYRGPAGYERTHDYWKITVGTDGSVTKEHVRVDENATNTENNISRAPKLDFETLSKINPEVYSSQANSVEEASQNKAEVNLIENNSMLANKPNEDNNIIEKYRIENQDKGIPRELNNAITGSNYDVLDKYLEDSSKLLANTANRAPARANRANRSPEENVFEDKNLRIKYDQMLYETDQKQVTISMNIFGKSTTEQQDKSLSVMLLVDRAKDDSRDGSMDETVNRFIQSLVDKAVADGITLNVGLADYGTPSTSHPDGGQELRNPYSERVTQRYEVTELVDKNGNVKLNGNYLANMNISPRSNSVNLQYQTVNLNSSGRTKIGSPFLTTYAEEEGEGSWKNETWKNSDKRIFVSFSHLESDFQDSFNGMIDGQTEYAFNKKDFANGLNLLRDDAEVFSFLFSKSLPEQRVEGSIPMADKGSMRLYEYMRYNNLIDYDHSFIFSNRNSWNNKLADGAKQGYKTNKYGETDTRVDYPDTVNLVLDKFPTKDTATNIGTINKGTIELTLKDPLKIAGFSTSDKNGKNYTGTQYSRMQVGDNLLRISDISLKKGENIRVLLTLNLSDLTPNQEQNILSWQIKPAANAEAYPVTKTPRVKYNKVAPPVGDKYSQTVKFVFTDDPASKPGGVVGRLSFEVFEAGEWKKVENPFDDMRINAGGFPNGVEVMPVVYDQLDSNKKYRVRYESTETSWGRLPNPEYFDIDFSKADPETKKLPDIEIQQGHTIKVFNKDESGFRIPLRIKKTAEDGYPLDGATFRARKLIDGEEGTAYYNEAYDQISAATGLSGDNYFRELSPGVYELTETKVPAGFREDVKNKKWYFKVERNKNVAATAANSMTITFDFTENITASTKFTKGISEEEKQNLIALGTIVGIGNASVLQNNDYITIVPQDEDDGRSKPARPDAPYPTIDEIGVKNFNATTKFSFQKFDETGRNILGGAKFKLTKTDKNGNVITKNVDGKDVPVYEQIRESDPNTGFVEFDGLTKNSAEDGDKYILEEIEAPAGYEIVKDKFGLQVFVSEGGNWEFKYLDEANPLVVFRDNKVAGIRNNLSRIDFKFKKVDSKGENVYVSRFQLQGVYSDKTKDNYNQVIKQGEPGYYNSIKYTTSTPNYRFEDLEEGRYKLTEINYTKYEKPHDWYFNVVRDKTSGKLSFDFSELQDDKTFDYVLNAEDGTYDVKVINYERIKFAIQKIDISEKDKTDDEIKGLQNAKFSLKKIYTKDLTIEELNDQAIKDKYFIEYEMNGDKYVLDEDGNVKTKDPDKKGFGYYQEKSLLGFTSHTFEDLSEGIYELEELKPPQGYENSKDQRKWIIKVVKDDATKSLKVLYDKDFESSYYKDIDQYDKNGKIVLDDNRTPNLILGINGSKTRIINSRDTIDLKFKKTDTSDKPLVGASFRLDKISNDSKDLDAAKVKDPKILSTKFGESVLKGTGEDQIAEVLIKDLDEGIYILKETKTPEGYKLPIRDFVVQVRESDKEDHPAGYLVFNIYERDLSSDPPKIIDRGEGEHTNTDFINLVLESVSSGFDGTRKYHEEYVYRIRNFKDIGFKFLKVYKDENGLETIKRGKLKVKLEPDESLEIPFDKTKANYTIEKEFNLLYDYDQMKLQLENPITGDYILTEVQAPIGYTKTKNKYKIHMDVEKETVTLVAVLDADGNILKNDKGQNITEDGRVIPDGGINISTNADKFNLNIVNEKSVFPWTGGPGTIIFTLGGSMIMAAGAYLYLRKRRYAED